MPGFSEAKKIETPTSEKKEPEFEIGQNVIVRRSSGDFETGWQVIEKGIGVAKVMKPVNERKKIVKMVDLKDLQDWNDETKFLRDQKVLLKEEDNIPWPGWVVVLTDSSSGKIKVYNKTVGKTLNVEPEDLIKDFSQGERYREVKK